MKIDLNKLIIVDIETIVNCFTLYAKDYVTGAEKSFIIFPDRKYDKQALELYQFLRTCVRTGYTFITFNGLWFDQQVLHYFYEWCSERQDPLYDLDTTFIVTSLYNKAQEIINLSEDDKFKTLVPESKLYLLTIDLFKQKQYDRLQKSTSLKWLEFTMRFPTIEDMAHPHDQPITLEQIPELLHYNRNDVLATYEFFTLIKFETDIRIYLGDMYKRNLLNASEPRMAREIFGTILAPELDLTYGELRKLRTIREEVVFADIIFPYVKFVTPELQKVLAMCKEKVLDCRPDSKDEFKHDFLYKGLEIFLGLGGIHASVPPGLFVPSKDEICKDSDGKSYYPNIAMQNKLKPEHLGETFTTVYANIYELRKPLPKSDPRNYVYKILLNSVFGLSSEPNSYFYDKKFTYAVTVNGQLLLLMLMEALTVSIPNIRILQMNTDGISYIYNKKHQKMVENIWRWWTKMTNIELEHVDYAKIALQDVNNYLAVPFVGELKKKGIFETKPDWHKNPSHLIIPKAAEQYFMYNTPIEDTIKNCTDIYDFCGGIKRRNNVTLNLYKNINGGSIAQVQPKVTRYFVSSNAAESGILVKDYDDGRQISALANTQVETLNNVSITDAHHYKIDYNYYITKTRDMVHSIVPIQTTLF